MRALSLFGTAALLVALLSIGPSAPAADWPQWRGLNRDGVSPEKGLLASWPKGGPKLLWTYKNGGLGYAGPAVVNGTLYTMGARGDNEVVFALNGKGKEEWSAEIGPVFDFKGNQWSRGPNSTPSVTGDRVFALGSQGILVCVDKASGKMLWKKNLPKEMAAEVRPEGGGPPKFGWGYCWSPLVDGDKLICVPGGPKGLFAALDLKTGDVLWRSKDVKEPATYSSPVATNGGGVRHYVYILQDQIVGVSAKDGALLWAHKLPEKYADVVCPSPIVRGNHVYVGVGYNGGGILLSLSGADGKVKATVVYTKEEIGNKQGGIVLMGDYLYGFNEEKAWMCQEFLTGAVKWGDAPKRTQLKDGSVAGADGKLYVLEERTGNVGMLAASPDGYKELARFKLPETSMNRKPSGKIWTHPVISNGNLYLRDQELIFCYQIK
jgi:outer membrane protein assembly factor BamB